MAKPLTGEQKDKIREEIRDQWKGITFLNPVELVGVPCKWSGERLTDQDKADLRKAIETQCTGLRSEVQALPSGMTLKPIAHACEKCSKTHSEGNPLTYSATHNVVWCASCRAVVESGDPGNIVGERFSRGSEVNEKMTVDQRRAALGWVPLSPDTIRDENGEPHYLHNRDGSLVTDQDGYRVLRDQHSADATMAMEFPNQEPPCASDVQGTVREIDKSRFFNQDTLKRMAEEPPRKIILTLKGAPEEHQVKVKMEAVGEEWDGSFTIDELSYAPKATAASETATPMVDANGDPVTLYGPPVHVSNLVPSIGEPIEAVPHDTPEPESEANAMMRFMSKSTSEWGK